eukprot:TRINITY_DN12755_c0_g1_i1.p1 TRINITY_DN12755_c0_g1~~TRINITY_DN12755_c0_g1_i1.p1  ORF type:complete len:204 (+),score=14.63 TRINITY_DN12755_c0_g1_i1:47-658(+)
MTFRAMLYALLPCVVCAITPLKPTWKSEVLTRDIGARPMVSTALKVDGNYAYHLSRSNDVTDGWLTIVDISNPSSPTTKSETQIADAKYTRDIVISGNTAYISHKAKRDASTSHAWSGITVMNVANKEAPTQITKGISGANATYLKDGYWHSLEKHGNYLYAVVHGEEQSLAILDVTDPAAAPVLQSKAFDFPVAPTPTPLTT